MKCNKKSPNRYWRRAPVLPSERLEAMRSLPNSEVARCFGLKPSSRANIGKQRLSYGIPNPILVRTCFCGKTFRTTNPNVSYCSGACARAWRYAAKSLKRMPKHTIAFIRSDDELRSIWAMIALFEGFRIWKLSHPNTRSEVYFEVNRSHDKDAARRQRELRCRRRMGKQSRTSG